MKNWEGEEVRDSGLCFLDLTIYSYVRVIITHKMQFHSHLPRAGRRTQSVSGHESLISNSCQCSCPLTTLMAINPDPTYRAPGHDPENMKCLCWNVIVYWFFFLNLFLFDQNFIYPKCHTDTHLHNYTLLCIHTRTGSRNMGYVYRIHNTAAFDVFKSERESEKKK